MHQPCTSIVSSSELRPHCLVTVIPRRGIFYARDSLTMAILQSKSLQQICHVCADWSERNPKPAGPLITISGKTKYVHVHLLTSALSTRRGTMFYSCPVPCYDMLGFTTGGLIIEGPSGRAFFPSH